MSPRRGQWCRLVVALPAMAGSMFFVLVLFGWLGAWEGLILIGWLGAGIALLTRRGEQAAVRAGCRFRLPTAAQAGVSASAWARSLASAGRRDDQVDLYVMRSAEVNAFAAGRRSIAVTNGTLAAVVGRRLSEGQLTAILIHEIGHLELGATRYGLVTAFLTTPSRVLGRLFGALTGIATRRRSHAWAAVQLGSGAVVALVQLVEGRQWASVLVLGAVLGASIVCPQADARISRNSEYEADVYAARLGFGRDLSRALEVLTDERDGAPIRCKRVLARHPDVASRVDAMRFRLRAGGPSRRSGASHLA